jgi:methyl-accepting chemotaxis protein
MKTWWSRLSLKSKLQIPIQLLLLVVLFFAQRWALNQYESQILVEARQKAQISSDGVINGLNMLMENGNISDVEQRKLYIRKMGESEKVEELRIIRNKQVSEQFGPGLPEEQARDDMDHLAMDSAKTQFRQEVLQNGIPALRVVVPFVVSTNFRGTNCLNCHLVKEGTVNGAASVTINLADEFAAIQRANLWMWGVQLLLQVFFFLIIGWMIDRVIAPTKNLQNVMLAMRSDGDVSRRLEVRTEDEIGQTGKAFNSLAESFQAIVSQVNGYAGKIVEATGKLNENAVQVSTGSQRQNEAAVNVASALEEISASIASVAGTTREVAQRSQESLQAAQQGDASLNEMRREIDHVESMVHKMAESMSNFVQSAKAITGMTQQVRDIAEQTNLLALNAAIEAARAGEQGRGFAVVADEVRKLAEKSAQSAIEIDGVTKALSDQSEQVEQNVQSGLHSLGASQKCMQSLSTVLTQSNDLVKGVNSGVDHITSSVGEQEKAIHEITRNVENITAMAAGNHATIENVAQSIKQLEELAAGLRQSVEKFKV